MESKRKQNNKTKTDKGVATRGAGGTGEQEEEEKEEETRGKKRKGNQGKAEVPRTPTRLCLRLPVTPCGLAEPWLDFGVLPRKGLQRYLQCKAEFFSYAPPLKPSIN